MGTWHGIYFSIKAKKKNYKGHTKRKAEMGKLISYSSFSDKVLQGEASDEKANYQC